MLSFFGDFGFVATNATVASALMSDDITRAAEPAWLRIVAADGVALEAQVVVPPGARAAVVLCHPHPEFGGSMQSIVPSELFRLLPVAGIAALRFNFRGVGASEGSHARGVDEALDVSAAVGALGERTPGLPLVVAGWSFGADVSLTVVDDAITGWVPIAPPLAVVDVSTMLAAGDPRPKLLVVPEHDQYDPPDRVRKMTADWVATSIEVVPGADHFLVGRTDRVAELVVGFVDRLTAAGR